SIAYNYYPAPDSATGTVTENVAYDQRGRTFGTQLTIGVSGGSNITFPTFPTYLKTQTYNDADQEVTTQTSSGGTTDYSFTQLYDSTTGVASGLTNGSTALASLSYNIHALVSGITLMNSAGSSLATETLTYDGNQRPAS